MVTGPPRFTIGVSLKMYFNHARTLEWARAVGEIARRHPAVQAGIIELFVAPSFPALIPVRDALAGTLVRLCAQDVATADSGAFTGEVSAVELAEIGVTLAEIGHAERRRLYVEDDAMVAAKTAAALRNGITPLLCVGEAEQAPAPIAAQNVMDQIDSALTAARDAGSIGPVLIAYEPVWAIGAPEPASAEHIMSVVAAVEAHLANMPDLLGSRVIYGGSAGPGLLSSLRGEVRGLFLGRFAHNPTSISRVLDEALSVHQ